VERGQSLQNDAVFFAPVLVGFLPLVCGAYAELYTTFSTDESKGGTPVAENVVQESEKFVLIMKTVLENILL